MQIDDFFKVNHLPLAAKTLVVAVSGGPDSLALLDLLYQIKEQYHFRLLAAHLDHQLRPDSFKEEKVIAVYCQNKSIELINEKWPKSLQPLVGVEAAARKYRYDFLVKIMQNYQGDYLLTAHHMDDLLENILLKFLRSGNPSEMNSLKAISKMQGMTLLRPLLNVQKSELLRYDNKNHIPYVIDQTNNEDDTLRNKLRHHVIPLLKKENKQIGQNALRFSEEVSLLTSIADEKFAQLDQPEKFLSVAYRLKASALKELTGKEQRAFWQHFIWQTWHERVNSNLAHYTLLVYQGFFYLFKRLPFRPARREIILDHEFLFNKRKFLLSLKADRPHKLIGKFWATSKSHFTAGPILPGTKLLLKDGSHVKSKKMFAQSSIPNILRPYCLTIYDGDKVVFVEQTYTNQQVSSRAKCFYLYEDN